MAKDLTPEQRAIIESNTDRTFTDKRGSVRKPMQRTAYDFENLSFWGYFNPTFGASIFLSLLNGLSSIFKWKNLPKEIPVEIMERFIISAGRVKLIKVASKYYVVHIAPIKWNSYYDTLKSTIIEPFLPGLNNKYTESFKNVEIKNNNMGYSLGRSVFPFIQTIDETLFNLDTHSQLLTGKFAYLLDEADGLDEGERQILSDSINQFMINGNVIKVFEKSAAIDGKMPIIKIEMDDSTDSFIQIVRFNMSKMYSAIGIPNDNFEDKKERKITSEINVQNILESSVIEDMLNVRQRAVEQINEVFGLNVSVEVNPDYLSSNDEDESEGEDDVSMME